MIRKFSFFIIFLLFSQLQLSPAEGREQIFVSILPQKFFVQQICGDLLQVEVMVQPGASPATYEPKPSQMRKLAVSKAYLAIGVPFEKTWLERIKGVNPSMKVINTDANIEKLEMSAHAHGHEGHDEEERDSRDPHHGNGHTGLDPHIWLSPVLAKTQAQTIFSALSEIFPENREFFSTNYASLVTQLEHLHSRLLKELAPAKGKRFMVFHPSWGYFAKEYGLEQVAIEIEGKNPKPAQVKELIELGRKLGITVILAQSQFSTKSAEMIARELNGQVLAVDPLSLDYIANLEKTALAIKNAVR